MIGDDAGELRVGYDAGVLIGVTRREIHGALGYTSNPLSYGSSINYTQVYAMNA
jgi:hypothetical protein